MISKINVTALSLILGLLAAALCSPAHADNFAYVTNRGFNSFHSISVINTTTNTIDETLILDSEPFGIAVTPNGAFAYVANANSNTVTVINTATNTVETTVAVGSAPIGIAITPDSAFVYVANQQSGNVSVINTATNTVDTTVTVESGPSDVAVTPNGAFAYVANGFSNTVSLVNTATNTVETTLVVGTRPSGVAITPDGAFAYVTNLLSGNVSVINTATNTVDTTVTVQSGPSDVAVTPNGAFAYVANFSSNTVSLINTASNTVGATVIVGVRPLGIAITPDGTFAYVANQGSKNVSVINTATNGVDVTMAVVGSNSFPFDVAITPAANSATLIASYDLEADFSDELGSPPIASNGGTLESNGYAFGQNQGLSLSNVLDADTYSIEMLFRVDDTAAGGITTKFIDFANLAEDAGWYTGGNAMMGQNGPLAFSGAGLVLGPTVVFQNDQLIQIVVTRDGSNGEVVGYANGVEQVRFIDGLVETDFSGPTNVAQFFIDDAQSGQVEASGGFVDYIRIYDGPLTPEQVSDLVPDIDGDGEPDFVDNCPSLFNPDQTDDNGDGFGDDCVDPSVTIPPGADVGENPTIGSNTTIASGSSIGDNADIGDDVTISKDSDIGDDVTVGDDSEIAKDSVVGDGVTIGDNVFIAKEVQIGAGVQIGDDCIINKGAIIGDNAVLGVGVIVGMDATIAADAVVPDGTNVPNGGSFP